MLFFQTELMKRAAHLIITLNFLLVKTKIINIEWLSFGEVRRASIQLVGFTTSH